MSALPNIRHHTASSRLRRDLVQQPLPGGGSACCRQRRRPPRARRQTTTRPRRRATHGNGARHHHRLPATAGHGAAAGRGARAEGLSVVPSNAGRHTQSMPRALLLVHNRALAGLSLENDVTTSRAALCWHSGTLRKTQIDPAFPRSPTRPRRFPHHQDCRHQARPLHAGGDKPQLQQPWTFPVCEKIGVGVGCEMGRDQVQVSTFTVHNLRPVSTACNHDISHN
jgi:hypothetical protein